MINSSLYMVMTTVTEKCFLESGVPKQLYSIGKYKEGAVCIERNFRKGETIVYNGIDGKEENLVAYNGTYLAVSDFIERVYAKMKNDN